MSQSFPTTQLQSAAAAAAGEREVCDPAARLEFFILQNAFPGASEAELRECRAVTRPAVLVGAVSDGEGRFPPGAVSAGPKGPKGSL